MPLPVSLAQVIQAGITRANEDVYTSLPAVVKSYNPVTQEVDVELAVKLVKRDEEGSPVYFECPIISAVKVAYPRGGGFILSFPLSPGDSGLLVVSSIDVSQWELTGAVPSEPMNLFRQNLSSCCFFPGWFPDVDPPHPLDAAARAAGAVIGVDGGVQAQITSTEIKQGGTTATHPVMKADALMTYLATLVSAIATAVTPVGTNAAFTSTMGFATTALTANGPSPVVKAV